MGLTYYEDIRDKSQTCSCGHPKRNHHYLIVVGDNSGRCLSRRCTCPIYDKENQ